MKKVKIKILYLIFFVFINNPIKAHNSVNGGCQTHCKKEINNLNIKNKKVKIIKQIQDFDFNSCLKKSLCRG